jgi:integrase
MAGKNPAPGIRRTPYGWQAYVSVDGEWRSKRFPRDADLDEMLRWRDAEKRRSVWAVRQDKPDKGTLAADATDYLKAVASMPSFVDRKFHIDAWVDTLGKDANRRDITPMMIRQALEGWRITDQLSNASLNRRRTALMHFYRVVDPMGANPVQSVPRYREQIPTWHLPTMAQAARAISFVGSDLHRAQWRVGTKTRARLAALLWTGLPASQLMAIEPRDIDWQARTLLVRGRRKGRGTRDRRLPLLPRAVAALRRMVKADALGKFSTSGMHKSLRHACDKAGVPRCGVHDLRHVFGSFVARTVKDDRVVAELLMHTSPNQTRRYTEDSVPARLTDALAMLSGKGRKSA